MKFSVSQRVLQDLELNKKEKPQSKHQLYKILSQTPHPHLYPMKVAGTKKYSQQISPNMSTSIPFGRGDLSTTNYNSQSITQSRIGGTNAGGPTPVSPAKHNISHSKLKTIYSQHRSSPSMKTLMSLKSMNTTHKRADSLINKNTSYLQLQVGVKNQNLNGELSYKQDFHKNIFFPLIVNKNIIAAESDETQSVETSKLQMQNGDASLFQNHPYYQDFEHKMHDYLQLNKIDKAINILDEDLNDDPQKQIIEAFKNSTLFQDLIRKNNGIVEDNGQVYNLRNNEEMVRYVNREIENKEKTYDAQDTQQLVYNRRQIKYLFSSLIEKNYEQQMKPDYEKQFQNDLFKTTAQNDYENQQSLIKKSKKLDLFDPLKVLDYYQQSKNHKIAQAQEDEIKNKIIEFARGLEMDKNKDYEKLRQKFHLTYNFSHKDQLEGEDPNSIKKQLARFLSEQKLKVDLVDHSEEVGRGVFFDENNKMIDYDQYIQKDKTTLGSNRNVDQYYLNNDNYKDDVPFDLYNMVSLAKRIDFKTKLDLNLADITKDIIKSQFDEKNELNTIQDLARKHLPKEIIEEDGQFYIQSITDLEQNKSAKKNEAGQSKLELEQNAMKKSSSSRNFIENIKNNSQQQSDDLSQQQMPRSKYNKWYINANHRFQKEINLNKQPGIKVFDAQKFKNSSELKKSGFIPYFKFGKYTQYDIQQDHELKDAMAKYQNIQKHLKDNEIALVYKNYLSEKKGGDKFLPNYLKKLKPITPKNKNNKKDDFFS